ncbi:MAG: hypothetical protein ABI968_15610 [Acidobacteriota bacterium]
MTRAMRLLVFACLAAPVVAFIVYRLAKGLGFLDPPWNKEHEHRRAIIAALFAFLTLLPIMLFGYTNDWPRVWWIFGVLDALALAAFAAMGCAATVRLWRLRHAGGHLRGAAPAASAAAPSDDVAGKPLS